MRLFLASLAWLVSACAVSQGFAGTKTGAAASAPASGSGPGIPAMLQMLLAVGIVVFLLKAVLPKIASKVNKKLVTGASSTLKIEESANFAGGALYVVRARRKTLLLGVNGTAVTCLADLTEPEDAQPLPSTFEEVLQASEPFEAASVEAVVEAPATREVPDIELALSRLQRLSG